MNKKKLPDVPEAKAPVTEEKLEIEEQEIIVAPVEEQQVSIGVKTQQQISLDEWVPKTKIGKLIKSGEIKSIDVVLDSGLPIQETQIVDMLVPNMQSDLLSVGQSKGKFGGGKRSIWRQTQKKTAEGNKPSFATLSIIGNRDGYFGIGFGKAKETVPAREKALRNAKLGLVKIVRGCGSWTCGCGSPHSIPFKVEGRSGSVRIKLMPAPRGTGLIVERELKKILSLAGIKDIYSKTFGQTRTKLNLIYACYNALRKLNEVKTQSNQIQRLGILEGSSVK